MASPRMRVPGAPGRTKSRFEPMDSNRAITSCWLPCPMASMATTAATPMITPSRVSAVRKRFARSERKAIFTDSSTCTIGEGPLRE